MQDQSLYILIDQTLKDIYNKIDSLNNDDLDLEYSDGKLVIEFEQTGVKLILSRQSSTNQIWFAEPNGGWKFDYRKDKWIDDKRNVELVQTLSDLISKELGETISLIKN